LEKDPQLNFAQDEHKRAVNQLDEFLEEQVKWERDILQSRWIADGDTCSRAFFQNFRSLAASTQIDEIFDEHNHLVTSWADISKAAVAHFMKILGTSQGKDSIQMERVLQAQLDRIPAQDRALMEQSITLDDLYNATKAMANGKCPGPDGAPTEFFIQNWKIVGPILHDALMEGIAAGRLDTAFTRGFIVLLIKKGDQRLFSNKRPLTMLNVIYKIVAKAYQLCLTTVLQNFVTAQQSACLPGRSIHHSILLLSELLHHAEGSNLDHILLKLDMMKAFDMVEWEFLSALLEKVGFGPNFIRFLQASWASDISNPH
jgi:hypothetical protein